MSADSGFHVLYHVPVSDADRQKCSLGLHPADMIKTRYECHGTESAHRHDGQIGSGRRRHPAQIGDARCQGLELRVTERGAKSFAFQYRSKRDGKVVRLTLGTYPDLGLADARMKAEQYRHLIAQGGDPRDEKRNAVTSAKRQGKTSRKSPSYTWSNTPSRIRQVGRMTYRT